jgi:hypothetical protein
MKKQKKMIEITVEEYEKLLCDSDFLDCLEACGVDNWDGYGDAKIMQREYSEGDE